MVSRSICMVLHNANMVIRSIKSQPCNYGGFIHNFSRGSRFSDLTANRTAMTTVPNCVKIIYTYEICMYAIKEYVLQASFYF